MRSPVLVPGLSALLLLAGCCDDCDHGLPPPPALVARPLSVLIEVYDPVTNWVWQNVDVRLVEARHEWSGCTCTPPLVEYFLTDAAGQVMFDEYLLADLAVGFLVDDAGRAVLSPAIEEDEVVLVFEVSAAGFTPVIVEVPVDWSEPDWFVPVPFF